MWCQLAQDEGGHGGSFAVVEYSTAEHAEEVQQVADGITVKGSQVQLSFCAPGAPGRSTLAALIAAQRVVSGALPRRATAVLASQVCLQLVLIPSALIVSLMVEIVHVFKVRSVFLKKLAKWCL